MCVWRENNLSLLLPTKALIPSKPNYLPKDPFPNMVHHIRRLEFQHLNLGRDVIPSLEGKRISSSIKWEKQTLSYRLISSPESGKVFAIFDLSLLKPFLWFPTAFWRQSELLNQQLKTILCHDRAQLSLLVSSLNPHRFSPNKPLASS